MEIPKQHTNYRSIGLTLVELLTALALVIIVLSIGIPGYRKIVGNNRVTAAVNAVASHLHFARSEAVTGGVPVVLCPSVDGEHCDDTFYWHEGFMVFADQNGNRTAGEGQPLLRYFRSDTGVSIRTSVGRKKLVYQPSGMSPGSTATITVCDRSKDIKPKAIIVSNAGRPRLSKKGADGKPLKCG